jgi:HAD superfamily hydrolase (TIGR01509 family)
MRQKETIVIEGVVLDFNGVVVDDEQLHKIAIQRVLQDLGINLNDSEYYKRFPSMLTSEIFELILTEDQVEMSVNNCVKKKNQYYEELLHQDFKFFPGVKELVVTIYALNYKLAIASTSPRRFIFMALKQLSILSKFSVITGYEDVTKGKPAPEVYCVTADHLGLPTAACVAIEDSPNGLASAKAAGMRCVVITNNFTESELTGADFVFPSLQDQRLRKLFLGFKRKGS